MASIGRNSGPSVTLPKSAPSDADLSDLSRKYSTEEPKLPSTVAQLSIFSKFTIWVLVYNLLAVAWGVFVRASKSGDGCGSHWPLCDGQWVPMNGPTAKLVEMSHRASTGLAGLLVVCVMVMALRKFPRKSQTVKATYVASALVLMEGLIGWALVRFQLVTNNASSGRAAIMSFHVVSTFMLGRLVGPHRLPRDGKKAKV